MPIHCNYCDSAAELYCIACYVDVCKEDMSKHLEECKVFDMKSYFMSINLKVTDDSIYKEVI